MASNKQACGSASADRSVRARRRCFRVLCKALRERYDIAVVTNDIYTQEDAKDLMRAEALPFERIVGVETGGCPHTAIREDASMNLAAVGTCSTGSPDLDVVFIESGGDNLSATFGPGWPT